MVALRGYVNPKNSPGPELLNDIKDDLACAVHMHCLDPDLWELRPDPPVVLVSLYTRKGEVFQLHLHLGDVRGAIYMMQPDEEDDIPPS